MTRSGRTDVLEQIDLGRKLSGCEITLARGAAGPRGASPPRCCGVL